MEISQMMLKVKLNPVHFLIPILTWKDWQGYNYPLFNKTN